MTEPRIVCPKCGIELVPLLRQRRERPKPTPTGRPAEPTLVEAAADDVDEDEDAETDAESAEADGESDDAPDEEPDDESKSSGSDERDRT